VTAPQFPAAWGAQPPAPVSQVPAGYAPPQPPAQQGYPQQLGQYPTPPQQMPGYPPQAPPMVPAPGYPQPQPPYGYPAQPGAQMAPYDPYAAAQQYQPPAPPQFTPAPGTIDEYLNQRAAGAQFWKFGQPGEVKIGMVERDLRDSDVSQVQFNGQPVRRKDGSVSTEKSLTIPFVNPDGTKSCFEFRGHQRTALEEAVSAGSGGARRLPEGGSMIRGTFTHTEPSRGGGSPKKIVKWEYVPAEQVQAPQHAAAMAAQPQHVQDALNHAAAQPPQQDLQYATPVPGAQQYQQPAMQAPPAQPQQPAQDPAYAAWLAGQQQQQFAPQQAAPAQQVPPPAAATPPNPQQAFPTPAPAPSFNPGAQGPPAPQPYQPPGMDPAAAQMFAGLMGGAQPGQ
jgi:hypothetical protein